MLTLYFAPHTCALATHIVLEEAKADYEQVRIDFGSTQQRSAEYLNLNPRGRVPALVTDDGVLTETPALLVYLAQLYPESGLIPESPFDLARLQAFNSYLCSTVHVAHAHRMRGYRWVDETETDAIKAMQRKAPQSVTAAFKLIEDELEGPWVMGDSYSIADPYLFTLAQWLEVDGADVAALPRVVEHRGRMLERPAVRRAIELETAGV